MQASKAVTTPDQSLSLDKIHALCDSLTSTLYINLADADHPFLKKADGLNIVFRDTMPKGRAFLRSPEWVAILHLESGFGLVCRNSLELGGPQA